MLVFPCITGVMFLLPVSLLTAMLKDEEVSSLGLTILYGNALLHQ